MALNFPDSPTTGDTYTYGTATYRYADGKWSPVRGQTQYVNSSYSALPFDIIYADTSSTAFTITLPATPVNFATVKIIDAEGTHLINQVTVDRNGSTIEGNASNWTIPNAGLETTFIYYNSTWNVFQSSNPPYLEVTIPAITGPVTGEELATIQLTISNYSGSYSYTIIESAGSASRTFDKIDWTLPAVSENTVHTIQVNATSGAVTSSYVYSVTVINIEVIADSAIVITNHNVNTSSEGWTII